MRHTMQTGHGELVKIGDLEIHPEEGLVLADGRALMLESDGFAWPQRDGLKWPHLALVDVLVR